MGLGRRHQAGHLGRAGYDFSEVQYSRRSFTNSPGLMGTSDGLILCCQNNHNNQDTDLVNLRLPISGAMISTDLYPTSECKLKHPWWMMSNGGPLNARYANVSKISSPSVRMVR